MKNMKKFETPKMAIIHLSDEDVMRTSCGTNMCYGFDCPDCPIACTGIYHCDIFKCGSY